MRHVRARMPIGVVEERAGQTQDDEDALEREKKRLYNGE